MKKAFSFRDPAFLAAVSRKNINLDDFYFYLDLEQPDGPTALPSAIDFGTGAVEPLILLRAEDATTTNWINRGSLGGALTAVNIRSEDLNQDTPYSSTSAKGVRLSNTDGAERYYEAPDSTWFDYADGDMYVEAVFCRNTAATTFSLLGKRNVAASGNIGWNIYGVSGSAVTFNLRAAADANRSASVSITPQAWTLINGFVDASDTTTTGFRVFRGNDSSATGVHATGSVSNASLARVGAWLDYPAYSTDITLCYLAFYSAADLGFPGGASNLPSMTTIIRDRQLLLAGTKPAKAPEITQYVDPFRVSYKITDGKMKGFRTGSGFTVVDQYPVKSTPVTKRGLDFSSNLGTNAVNGELFTTGWTYTDTIIANNASVSSPVTPFRSAGPTSLTGSVGSSNKYISYPFSAPNTTSRIWQCFVKAGNKTVAHVGINQGIITNPIEAYIDLTTGVVATISGEVGCTPYIDGWYLVYFRYAPVSTDNTAADFGFVDATGSATCTGDGSTINGYVYGAQVVLLNNQALTPLPVAITNETVSAPIMNYNGTGVLRPYSLWAEVFAQSVLTSAATQVVPISIRSSTSDITNLLVGANAVAIPRISTVGNNTTAPVPGTQFVINADLSGADWPEGDIVRYASSCGTDDIKLLAPSGVVGTDTSGTPVEATTLISVGTNGSNQSSGRAILTKRVGILNKTIASVDV